MTHTPQKFLFLCFIDHILREGYERKELRLLGISWSLRYLVFFASKGLVSSFSLSLGSERAKLTFNTDQSITSYHYEDYSIYRATHSTGC